MAVVNIDSNNFDAEIMQEERITILKFGATWCGPCKKLDPIIDEISEENSDIKVGYVNIDNERALAIKYAVLSVPTTLFFKGGKVMDTIVGLVPKAKILTAVEKLRG